MFTPLILFLGLTVATAVIAHWSDNLGKKLGKKRVSIFGLRPRTTATILTVASSWGIMLFTLVALLVAVAPLRRALFSYDRERAQYQRDREQAQREIETTREVARQRLRATQEQVNATREQLGATETQLNGAKSQLGAAQSKLDRANNALQRAENDARKAEAEGKKSVDLARERTTEAQNRLAESRGRLVEAQNRVAEAQKRLTTASKQEAAARKGEAAAQQETRIADRGTQRARGERQKAQQATQLALYDLRRVQKQRDVAQKQLTKVQGSLRNASASLSNATTSAFKVTRTLFETERRVLVLKAEREALENLATATLRDDAPIKVRQTFAARVIPANQTPGAIAAQLRDLLRQGREAFAESEDSAVTPNFPSGATLQLLPLTDQNGKSSTVLQGDLLLRRLARDIAASRQTTSIRLVSPRNYLSSETRIEAIFVAVPIAPAFRAGEILASSTIDGAQGDARIFRSLLDLTELGQREAKKRGVNPPQSPDEPSFYAAGTNVDLFRALRLIEQSKTRFRVNLVAARALSTVEPLQVRFEIDDALRAPTL